MSNESLMIMLIFTVSLALGLALQVRHLQKLAKELRYYNEIDMLSGLKNRNAFARQVNELERKNITLLVCDIDNLKLTNDTLGHVAGDELIRKAADILKRVCPPASQIFRMGGDEFLVLLPEEIDDMSSRQVVASIKETIFLHNQFYNGLPLSLSVGLGSREDELETLFDIIKRADYAMYQHKHNCGASETRVSSR